MAVTLSCSSTSEDNTSHFSAVVTASGGKIAQESGQGAIESLIVPFQGRQKPVAHRWLVIIFMEKLILKTNDWEEIKMETKIGGKLALRKHLLILFLLSGLVAMTPAIGLAENDSARAKLGEVSNEEGKKEQAAFETYVNVSGGGELSEVNYREVSRLASRMMFHLAEGAYEAAAENNSKALSEVKQASKLSSLIRSVLPKSTVETVIKDRNGKVVYRDERTRQDDVIPIFRRSIKVDVVQPLVDVWRTDAKLKEYRLLIRTLLTFHCGLTYRSWN